MSLPLEGFLVIDGVRLEYRRVPPPVAGDAPTLVLLHEGLGCVSMWRDFPERLARATGLGAVLYSRRGYGRSDPGTVPLPYDYHVREAKTVLPAVLDAFGIQRAALIGHSDGGMMSLYYAGFDASRLDGGARTAAVVAISAHAFNEPQCIEGIVRTKASFEQGDLRQKLERWHGANTEGAFWGWCRTWLSPQFADWDMRPALAKVTAPTLVVQGDGDEYGTLEQVEAFVTGVAGPAEALILPDCGHWPHMQQPQRLIEAISRFLAQTVNLPEPR